MATSPTLDWKPAVKGILEETPSSSMARMVTAISLGDKDAHAVIEMDADPVGLICVVLTKDGKKLVKVVEEPVPGFYKAGDGTVYPAHSVRGAARVVITAIDPKEVFGE